MAAQAQYVFRRALDRQHPGVRPLYQHRNPPPFEIEMHLVNLFPAGNVDLAMLQDGVVERAFQAALEVTVEIGQLQHPRAFPPQGVDVAFQADAGLGQGAGLVGAEHVHRPHVLDRRRPFDDDPPGRHAQRAARQGHRHHHGQQLRRQPHRQRYGEQERLQQGTVEGHVDQQREQHQQQGQTHDEQAEMARAALKGGRRRRQRQAVRNLAEGGSAAGTAEQDLGRAAHHRAAHEYSVVRLGRPVVGTGRRSGVMQQKLLAQGFTQVYSVKGGMAGSGEGTGWLAQGLPVVR